MLKHKIILMILSIVFGLGMLYEVIGIAVAVYVNVILDEHVIIHSTDESNYGYTVFHTIENSGLPIPCLLYTSPSPRDQRGSRMPSSA